MKMSKNGKFPVKGKPDAMGRYMKAVSYTDNAMPEVKFLIDKMNEEGMPIREMESKSGVDASSILYMCKGRSPKLSTIKTMLEVFGYGISITPMDRKSRSGGS